MTKHPLSQIHPDAIIAKLVNLYILIKMLKLELVRKYILTLPSWKELELVKNVDCSPAQWSEQFHRI